jgi:hypothetical protein
MPPLEGAAGASRDGGRIRAELTATLYRHAPLAILGSLFVPVLLVAALWDAVVPGRATASADGEPWRSVDFRVVPSGPVPPVARPADLLPLAAGTVWTYAVVQEAGPVGRLSLPPGATAGADGKYRTTATMTVAGTDEAGTRVESRCDGAVVFEEWWRLDQKGWSATRRKTPTETVEVDPPQLLVRLPLRS